MSYDEKRNSGVQIGTLGGCLIEGDSEQKARERKIKRRALAISIALQSLLLVGLVLTPLLAKTEKLPFTIVTPMPPYHVVHDRTPVRRIENQPPRPQTGFVAPTNIPPHIIMHDGPRPQTSTTSDDTFNLNSTVPISGPVGATELFRGNKGPTPPNDPNGNERKRITVGGAVQQAMLTHRVEPCFPPLARQLRRGGQVRLRAVISTDGTIESLQLIDGDPLFVQCAMDAVRQWRYKPTTLNSSPVEVETIITVIYTLNQ